ncbi:MAG: hypothetical protein ACOH2V_13225 [Candidatus Saccharimonadaceae bacterium]
MKDDAVTLWSKAILKKDSSHTWKVVTDNGVVKRPTNSAVGVRPVVLVFDEK